MLLACYLCPPLAVLFMGRPFSAIYNFFLTSLFWVPGVNHALVVYADYKSTKSVKQITGAINNPAWTQQQRAPRGGQRVQREVVVVYDNPHVGKNGTYFRPKN